MASLLKRRTFWAGLVAIAVLSLGIAFWRGWLPGQAAQQAEAPVAAPAGGAAQSPETPSLDVPSAITVILVCSYAIDRVLKGLLFLLSLVPAWSARFPDPSTLPSPDSSKNEAAAAESAKNRKQADVRQRLIYFGPAFVLAAGLAIFGHVRVLHILGFPDKETTDVLADILLTALILMGGADQTSQVLRLLGVKTMPSKEEPSQSRPIEITGKLILEEPAAQSPVREQAAKAAAGSPGN